MYQIHKVKTEDKMYEHAYLIQCKMGILFLKFMKTHPDYTAFSKSNPKEGNLIVSNIIVCLIILFK